MVASRITGAVLSILFSILPMAHAKDFPEPQPAPAASTNPAWSSNVWMSYGLSPAERADYSRRVRDRLLSYEKQTSKSVAGGREQNLEPVWKTQMAQGKLELSRKEKHCAVGLEALSAIHTHLGGARVLYGPQTLVLMRGHQTSIYSKEGLTLIDTETGDRKNDPKKKIIEGLQEAFLSLLPPVPPPADVPEARLAAYQRAMRSHLETLRKCTDFMEPDWVGELTTRYRLEGKEPDGSKKGSGRGPNKGKGKGAGQRKRLDDKDGQH